jgi:hypothetical protein
MAWLHSNSGPILPTASWHAPGFAATAAEPVPAPKATDEAWAGQHGGNAAEPVVGADDASLLVMVNGVARQPIRPDHGQPNMQEQQLQQHITPVSSRMQKIQATLAAAAAELQPYQIKINDLQAEARTLRVGDRCSGWAGIYNWKLAICAGHSLQDYLEPTDVACCCQNAG